MISEKTIRLIKKLPLLLLLVPLFMIIHKIRHERSIKDFSYTFGQIDMCYPKRNDLHLHYYYTVNGIEYDGNFLCEDCVRNYKYYNDLKDIKIKYSNSNPGVSEIDDSRINQ